MAAFVGLCNVHDGVADPVIRPEMDAGAAHWDDDPVPWACLVPTP